MRQRDIVDSFKKYNETTHHIIGETLPEKQQVYCVKVFTAFIKAGVALNKIVLGISWKIMSSAFPIDETCKITSRSFLKKKKVVFDLKFKANSSW